MTCLLSLPRDIVIAMQKNIDSWLSRHITLHSYDSRRDELLSAAIHGIGILLSLIGLMFLIKKGVASRDGGTAIGYILYGLTMILLYSSSTFYHLVQPGDPKRLLRIFDHMSIYLLIAGTYTPVTIAVAGTWGSIIFSTIWGLAVFGMFFKIFFWGRLNLIHVLFYIVMGWVIVLGWNRLSATVEPDFLKMAIAGGITYTLGTIVYALNKIPYYHALWHLFVLGGSVFFFFGIYLYL